MRPSSELKAVLAAAILAALLFAAGVHFPGFGPLLGFFSCGPLIWVSYRRGALAGTLAGLLATAALLPAIPPPAAAFFVLEHALPGWYLGRRLSRGKGIVSSSIHAAAFISAALLGISVLWLRSTGSDPWVLFDEQLQASLREMGSGLGPVGAGPAQLPPELQSFVAVLRRVFPALAVIGLFGECALNSLIVLRALARTSPPAAPDPVLTAFALPEWIVWVLILGIAALWLPDATAVTVAANIVLPLLFLYLIQGLSVGLSLLQRVRPSRFVLTLLLLALVFQPYLLALPLLLGLLDFRFDFRKRFAPPPVQG
jgi:uncharacterized protein YybS (DUF2232 family)